MPGVGQLKYFYLEIPDVNSWFKKEIFFSPKQKSGSRRLNFKSKPNGIIFLVFNITRTSHFLVKKTFILCQ